MNDLALLLFSLEDEQTRLELADQFLAETHLLSIIPAQYIAYQTVIHEGLRRFLAGLSVDRLYHLASTVLESESDEQTSIEADTPAASEKTTSSLELSTLEMNDNILSKLKLVQLARNIPTLHKLGQILARHRQLEPSLKQWLTPLESTESYFSIEVYQPFIQQQLAENAEFCILNQEVLAEASVGAVVVFEWRGSAWRNHAQKGVFKLLKPDVDIFLQEEMQVLTKIAEYFDQHRQLYGLAALPIIEIIDDIKVALLSEIDLLHEQLHLQQAKAFYVHQPNIIIPTVLPLSTPQMTAMTWIEGCKITDAALTPAQKMNWAKQLFDSVVLQPLFSAQENVIFHGDPHAGNLFAVAGYTDYPKIALLDWSMAGQLSHVQRHALLKLCLALLAREERWIMQEIKQLAQAVPEDAQLLLLIEHALEQHDARVFAPMTVALTLVETLSRAGVKFSRDLLLFKKAIFTLEGVLYDLDPHFNMNQALLEKITHLFWLDAPLRWTSLWLPSLDSIMPYHSLVANQDVIRFLRHWTRFKT